MKKVMLCLVLWGVSLTMQSQTNFAVIAPSDKVNNSPWYGLGRSNVKFPNSTYYPIQLAGYYGVLFKTAHGELSMGLNGNVGIGTTNPTEKFQISNAYTFHDGGHKVIGFLYTPSNNGDLDATKYSGDIRYDPGLGNLRFGTSSTVSNVPVTRLTISKDGNVGIGTTSPDAKLAVDGIIHTKEVKVDLLGWSDFVFKKAYQLPTLEEVEKHIKATGHLKDIPSEKEVLKNGILLGEMNAKLLQKIEELTLYTIAQEKKIKQQEQENIKQAKQLKSLKGLSERLAEVEKQLKS